MDEQIFDHEHCPECNSDNVTYLDQGYDAYGEYEDVPEGVLLIRYTCMDCNYSFWFREDTDEVLSGNVCD